MLIVGKEAPRRIVSYFEHEFGAQRLNSKKDTKEIIEHGFNTVLICLSEKTLKDDRAISQVKAMVRAAHKKGLSCLADPWGIGKVFGGEGESAFTITGEKACFCNNHFDHLMQEWIGKVKEIRFDGVFWDEPDALFCDNHDEVDLIEKYSAQTKALGLSNSVCFPADARKVMTLMCMSALPTIDDIGVDPYWPNAFKKIPKEERNAYVAWWADVVSGIAKTSGKSCHLWLQGWEIGKDDIGMTEEFSGIMQEHGVEDFGFWSFRGQKNLIDRPEFAQPESVWRRVRTSLNPPLPEKLAV